MTKNQLQLGLIVAGALFLIFLAINAIGNNGVLSSSETIQLSFKQIQRSVNRSFPLSHSSTQVNINLKNPKVILKEGWEHVAINLDLSLAEKKRRANRNIFKSVYKGKVTLSGSLKYLPKSGKISLKDIKLRILNSKNINARKIAQIEKSLIPVLQKKFNKYPIHRLKGKQFKHELNKMTLNNIEINKNNVNLELALK
ncbi:hypothetical protein MNBD_GAMMA22-1832 [hydrothermal vent metagenome]|uniref:DUF1439 domain-containing protein n=1 Tax=hydrothermal vent metagenome TaxID=652676 RepID=A0A3B1ABP6_9ZZZZ